LNLEEFLARAGNLKTFIQCVSALSTPANSTVFQDIFGQCNMKIVLKALPSGEGYTKKELGTAANLQLVKLTYFGTRNCTSQLESTMKTI
jgi:hypothetical protein